VTNVRADELHLGAEPRELRRELLARVLAPPRHDEARPFPGERDRRRPTDPGERARDKNNG